MKFDTETELIDVLKSTIRSSYSRVTLNILEEVSLGYGIADMVLCDVNENLKIQKLNNVFLNKRDINIYNLIDRKINVDIIEIIDITRVSKIKVLESLQKLVNCGYVKLSNNHYKVLKEYEFSFNFNYAIEAKLRDWKRALKQAYRYKWFAEYSYVVLDEFSSNSALKNINTFKKYNVGLATINRDGELKRFYSPAKDKPFDKKMQMLLSEKIFNISTVC